VDISKTGPFFAIEEEEDDEQAGVYHVVDESGNKKLEAI